MVMNWGKYAHNGVLLEVEVDLMAQVVPEVVDAVRLPIVEVLLLTFGAVEIARLVKSVWEILHHAVLALSHLAQVLSVGEAAVQSCDELIVGTPFGLRFPIWRHLLHQPDAHVGLLRQSDDTLVFIVALLTADDAFLLAGWSIDALKVFSAADGLAPSHLINLTVPSLHSLLWVVVLIDLVQFSAILEDFDQEIYSVALVELLQDTDSKVHVSRLRCRLDIEVLVSEESVVRIIDRVVDRVSVPAATTVSEVVRVTLSVLTQTGNLVLRPHHRIVKASSCCCTELDLHEKSKTAVALAVVGTVLISEVESTEEDVEVLSNKRLRNLVAEGRMLHLDGGAGWQSVVRVHRLSDKSLLLRIIESDLEIESRLIALKI